MQLTGYETLHCDVGWQVFSFLKLTTDAGLTGVSEYNECYGSPGLTGVIERLAARILGGNPCAHERLSQQLYAITRQAQQIYQQAVVLKAMPMNNATQITDAERAVLARWFQAGAPH